MPLLVCPNCNVGMTNVQRSGVEIDICPQCRGVWLDRGELEKLLQPLRETSEQLPSSSFLPPGFGAGNSASVWGQSPPNPSQGYYEQPQHHGEHHGGHEHDRKYYSDDRHKKTGLRNLMNIFD